MGEMCKHMPKHPQRAAIIGSSSHPSRQCSAYVKKCVEFNNHFREVYRSSRSAADHNIEEVPDQCKVEKDHIDTVNINLITFNSKWLPITVNLKCHQTKLV